MPMAGMRNINKKGARAKNGVIEAYPLPEMLKLPGTIQSRHPLIMRKIRMKISPDNWNNKDLSSLRNIRIVLYLSTKIVF
jgi:hypothetical protein